MSEIYTRTRSRSVVASGTTQVGLPTEIDESGNLMDVPCVVPHLLTHSMVEQLT